MVDNGYKRMDESIWEYRQRIYDVTKFKAKLETLIPMKCKHYKELPNGQWISTETLVTTEIKKGFEIQVQTCTQCEQATAMTIKNVSNR